MNKFANQQIVAPVDFSQDADRGVDAALEIATSPGHVTVIHVATPLTAMEPYGWDVVDDDVRRERLEESFRQRYAAPKYAGIRFAVRFGDPGHEIAAFAKELPAGLIVMPSHGRTGFAHLLIGSVAERVVRLAHCPVLVLRN
jgi:nucleotide-binding universal stress UspA family protein